MLVRKFGSLFLLLALGGSGCIFSGDDDDGDTCVTKCDKDRATCVADCDKGDNSCSVSCDGDRDECHKDCD